MLITNCSLLDVVSGQVKPSSWISIQDRYIAAVGTAPEPAPQAGPGENILDLAGKTVIPGLIDAHLHLCVLQGGGPAETTQMNVQATETLKVLWGAKNAAQTLRSGFTTVRDMGQGDNLALRDAISMGAVPGPRIVACGWLGSTAGHGEQMMPEWHLGVPVRPNDLGVDGPWAVRKKVRQLIGRGVDCIKTFAAGESLIKHPWDRAWKEGPDYTLQELQAIVEESHMHGRKVAMHSLISRQGIKNAIAAGADTLEHGVRLDRQDAEAMARQGMFYIPTGAVVDGMWNVSSEADLQYLHIDFANARQFIADHLQSVALAREHGVKIALGTDTFRLLPHGGNAIELIWLVKAGLSPMEALQAATINAAQALGVEHLVGSLEAGKLADLVVVEGDPAQDITCLQSRANLKLVMKDGEVIQ